MSFLKRKKKDKEEEQQVQQEESVESILNEIKTIVSGGGEVKSEAEDEGDVLELTEIIESKIEEDTSAEDVIATIDEEKLLSEAANNVVEEEQSEEEKFVDVLEEIDSELASTEESNLSQSQEDVLNEIKQSILEPQVEEQKTEEPKIEEKIIEEAISEQINQQPEEILTENIEQPQEIVAPVEEVVTLKEEATETQTMAEETSQPKENLISKEKADKSAQAIKKLMHNIPRPKIEPLEFKGGFTVEDIVTESLRPMLKNWLDKNLEIIVRDVVEREIRKIIPREE